MGVAGQPHWSKVAVAGGCGERSPYHTGRWVTPATRAAQMRCCPTASR